MKHYGIVKNGVVVEAPLNLPRFYNGIANFHKKSDAELKEHGWYPCNVTGYDREREIRIENSKDISFDGDTITVTYNVYSKTNTDIVNEKKKVLSRLFKEAAKRPAVDTGLGFSVDGGPLDLMNFEAGRDIGLTTVKSSDNVLHEVTATELDTIIQKEEPEHEETA